MKQFLHNSLFFIVCGLVFSVGIELFLLTIPNEYTSKRKYIEERGDKVKVLVLGHSHTAAAIIPECLSDSTFNMAIAARLHYYDAALAERYIPTLKNLKCVIWPLGYNFQYSTYLYPCRKDRKDRAGSNSYYRCMYEKYMDISYERNIPYLHWSEVFKSNSRYFSRPFKNDYKDINVEEKRREIKPTVHRTGWKQKNPPMVIDYENPNAPLAKEEGLTDMKRIAEACRKAGVRLVVITTPCYETYREHMTERGIREMQECVEAMRSVYPKTEYYNYIDDPRFTEEDFGDTSHLSDYGAEKFSKILKDTLGL